MLIPAEATGEPEDIMRTWKQILTFRSVCLHPPPIFDDVLGVAASQEKPFGASLTQHVLLPFLHYCEVDIKKIGVNFKIIHFERGSFLPPLPCFEHADDGFRSQPEIVIGKLIRRVDHHVYFSR